MCAALSKPFIHTAYGGRQWETTSAHLISLVQRLHVRNDSSLDLPQGRALIIIIIIYAIMQLIDLSHLTASVTSAGLPVNFSFIFLKSFSFIWYYSF